MKAARQGASLKTKLWSHSLCPGVTFANNSYSHHSFAPHFHDHYVIMVVNEGINEGVCEKRKYQVTGNDILFINPGEIHTGSSYQKENLRYSAFYIETRFFTEHLQSIGGDTPPVFTGLLQTNGELVRDVRELIDCTLAGEMQSDIEEKKTKVFGELIGYAETKGREKAPKLSPASTQRVKAFIREQYAEQFSLAALAGHVGLSPYHLVRSFKQAVGITPFQFLRNFRVEKAKQELRGKKGIAEVAVEVGFYDQSHFHKHFKLVTGFTPREFIAQ